MGANNINIMPTQNSKYVVQHSKKVLDPDLIAGSE